MSDKPEPLSYKNRFVAKITQEIEGYASSDATPQSITNDGINTVILDVTLAEWKKLFSALFTGADFCYPDESDTVRWILIRSVEQPVSICARIIECLETDEDVQQALADLIANNPAVQAALQGLIDNGTLLIGNPVIAQNENNDELFAICTFLTDTMHDAIEDFFELYELATNARERGELIFEAIPVIETLPIDEISGYVSMLEENIVEGFIGQYTTTPVSGSRDRIRCALFCAALENDSTLTWEIVENYFWGRVGFTPTNVLNVIGEFIGFMLTGSWEGQEIVDISFGNFASAMRQGQKYGELLFPKMSTIAELGADQPDSDWNTVCEDCAEPDEWIIEDFQTGDMFEWEIVSAGATDYAAFDFGFTVGDDNTQIGIKNQYLGIEITDVRVYFDDETGALLAQSLGNYNATGFEAMTTANEILYEASEMSRDGGLFLNFVKSGTLAPRKIIEIWYKVAP